MSSGLITSRFHLIRIKGSSHENIAPDIDGWQPAETHRLRSRNALVAVETCDEELLAGKQDALRLSLDEQIRAGIDIVSDGEQTRQHFVTTFIEHLSGVDFENRQTVRIRNRYDASVPTVVDAVARQKPVFVDDAKYLRQLTDKPIGGRCPAR